jgi:hypothetical protein
MAMIATLLRNQDALLRLREQRELIPNAINETLCFAFGGAGRDSAVY